MRLATRADEMQIYDLLVDLWKHNAKGWGFPFDAELVLTTIECGTRPNPEDRTDPTNQRRAAIGVIDDSDGKLIGSAGIFIDPPTWFTRAVIPVELWLHVRREARGRRHLERDLARFTDWVHESLRPKEYPTPFPLMTGFMHRGARFQAMARLWPLLFKGAKPCGMLFWKD